MNIIERVPSEAKLRAFFRSTTFGKRPKCPRCQSTKVYRSEHRYRCPRCRKPFSLTSVSWLKGTKLPLKTIWLLSIYWQEKESVKTASKNTGVSLITARHWYTKFRTHLPENNPYFTNPCEADEAFVGKRKNNNQVMIIGVIEPSSGQVALELAHYRDQETLDTFILKYVSNKTTIATDAYSGYVGLDKFFGYAHTIANHDNGNFGPTNHIENVWSCFKRFLRRTHAHYRKHLIPDLVREFQIRKNIPELFENPYTYFTTCLHLVPSTF